MNDWKPYPKNRKIIDRGDYMLIVPESFKSETRKMPVFCGVCGIRFANKEEEKSYKKFQCCSSCADTWAYSHKEAWDNGWRPSIDQVKVSVEKRSITNLDIIFE